MKQERYQLYRAYQAMSLRNELQKAPDKKAWWQLYSACQCCKRLPSLIPAALRLGFKY